MNCKLFKGLVGMLAINMMVTHCQLSDDDIREVRTKICNSYRSMYVQLAYLSLYLARRASAVQKEGSKPSEQKEILDKTGKDMCYLLGLDDSKKLPLLTSSLDIDKAHYIKKDSHFRNFEKVEDDIKNALDSITRIMNIWDKYFNQSFAFFSKAAIFEKNANVYRLLFIDFVAIFFPVTKEIYRRYHVPFKKVKEEELYVKDIYVDGQRSYKDVEMYGSEKGLGIAQVAQKAYKGDIDLLERMYMDIQAHVKEMPTEMKTLITVFKYYRATLNKMT